MIEEGGECFDTLKGGNLLETGGSMDLEINIYHTVIKGGVQSKLTRETSWIPTVKL